MPREIRTLIKLNKKQTAEFIASLNDRSKDKIIRKTFRRVMKAKFNVIK